MQKVVINKLLKEALAVANDSVTLAEAYCGNESETLKHLTKKLKNLNRIAEQIKK